MRLQQKPNWLMEERLLSDSSWMVHKSSPKENPQRSAEKKNKP